MTNGYVKYWESAVSYKVGRLQGKKFAAAMLVALVALAGCAGSDKGDSAGNNSPGSASSGSNSSGPSSSGSQQVPSSSVQPSSQPEKTDNPKRKAADAFARLLLETDPKTLLDDGMVFTYSSYALVDLTDDDVPELLYNVAADNGVQYVYVYAFNGSDVVKSEDSLTAGVAAVGGFRGSLGYNAQKRVIVARSAQGGSGDVMVEEVAFVGNSLKRTTVYEGNVRNADNGEYDDGDNPIMWSPTFDLGPIHEAGGVTISDADTASAISEAKASGANVVRGKMGVYTYQQVLDLQGTTDPNPGADKGEKYVIFVFDAPTEVSALNGADPGSSTGKADMLLIRKSVYDERLIPQALEGADLVISFDDAQWPSDTSLPIGQPRGQITQILNR